MPLDDAILGPTPSRDNSEKKEKSSESKVEEDNLNLFLRDRPFSNFSNSSTASSIDTGLVNFRSQSCEQIKDLNSLGVSELLKQFSILPPVLKVNFEATVEIGQLKHHELSIRELEISHC